MYFKRLYSILLGYDHVNQGECIMKEDCIQRNGKIMGFYCYDECPVGTYQISENRCAGCYPRCGSFIEAITNNE